MSVTPKAVAAARPGHPVPEHAEAPGHDHADCAHAHDHARRAPQALAVAEETCRERGVRLTPIRREVLAALYENHRPLSAYELAERVGGKGDKALSAVSV
ncbi:hypothetical protein WDZ92_47390, partial [Nostoc sp. NIES-2111]